MRKYFAVFIIVFLVSFSISAQSNSSEKTYKLKGTIENQNSEVVAGANLYFTKNEKTNAVSADINGEFNVSLSAGNYEVTLNKELSKNFVAFIKSQENGLNPQNVIFKIKTESFSEKLYPKPLSLPNSSYPAAALAIRASGEVVVAVKINKDGKVTSAKAESGHPLLRVVSEQAAMKAVFESSVSNEEREVKLTYIFLTSEDEKKNSKRYSDIFRIQSVANTLPMEIDDWKLGHN